MTRQYNSDISATKQSIKLTEAHIEKLTAQLKQMEKEIEIAKMKIDEQSKGLKNITLPPINYADVEILNAARKGKEYRTTGKSVSLKPSP